MTPRTGRPKPAASGAARPPVLSQLPAKVEDVLEVVARIPAGKVVTYGDVAEMVGDRGARFVGNVLSRYGADLPWWRVLRAGGRPPTGLEASALEHYREEGTPLVAGASGGLRVDLARARWTPDLSAGFNGGAPGRERSAGGSRTTRS